MNEVITENDIKRSLKNRIKGINIYLDLMKEAERFNIDERKYRSFYKMNRAKLPDDFYKEYFTCLKEYLKREDIKMLKSTDVEKIAIIYEETLKRLLPKSKRVEASFTSKLLATVNPNIAVWDSNVLSHLDNVKVPYSLKDKDEQIKRTVDSYKNLINTINALKNNEGKMFIEVFDKTLESVKLESTYPLSKVTSTKKIDLVLWSLGKKPKEKSIKKY